MGKCKILSIDALNDGHGWCWNDWYCVGELTAEESATLTDTDEPDVIGMLIEHGICTERARALAYIVDDDYNMVLCSKDDDRPIYAIEYGPVLDWHG